MSTAMVVDDSRAVRRILSRQLQELGFEVCEAEHGRAALESLDRSAWLVDLAIIDWNMPVMNGIELVRAIRSNAAGTLMRLVMVTTENGIDQISEALEAGVDEYVMKPFTREVLEDKLRMLGIVYDGIR